MFVTEGLVGRVSRIDPKTGEVTTFASGLPKWIVGLGGAMDVAFIGKTAYVLVTMVGPDLGGSDVVGIYRVDGPNSFTVIVDLGAYSLSHPPRTSFFIPTGVHYALEPYRGGFLVTDGHHNRVLRVTLDGEITEVIAFGNIVPTGLALRGNVVYMAQAGPVPHLPEVGKVVSFDPKSPLVTEGRLGCQARRRRGVRPRAPSLRPFARGLSSRESRGFSGEPGHRLARGGQRGRHVHRRHGGS